MTEEQFQSNMQGAMAFQEMSEGYERQFWIAYQRGLSRHHRGASLETRDEDAKWLGATNSPDPNGFLRMRNTGYRAGLEGQNTHQAMKSFAIRQHRYELGRLGGSVKSERKTMAVRKNAKLGGRPKKENKM